MAYEHGSLELGIRNPFRFEGIIRATRGTITTIIGVIVLLSIAGHVAENRIFGWISAAVGFILLSNGLWTVGSGLMQTLRFFVGRSVPTSLSYNHAKSEADTAKAESHDVAYDADQLEQMLVGRKNLTFTEPEGLIGRVIHTLFPKLTFVPYPIRNLAQQITDTLLQTVLALIAYGLALFVLSTGLLGESSKFIFPIVSTLLLLYLIVIWFSAGRPISRRVTHSNLKRGASGIARTLVLAITIPLAAGYLTNQLLTEIGGHRGFKTIFSSVEKLTNTTDAFSVGLLNHVYQGVSASSWIMVIGGLGCLSFALFACLIANRCNKANPITEVAELRENWQESVHPREIFINLDSMVMANRRYKEVPNREYRSLRPMLKEQSNGKGAFYGETIQETQPRVKAEPQQGFAKYVRVASTSLGQLLMLTCSLILFFQYETIFDFMRIIYDQIPRGVSVKEAYQFGAQYGDDFSSIINAILGLMVFGLFGRLLTNLTHVFWSEIQFESQLIYFKCEGTFTESKLSTGKGIYDSTQSENVIVRSSMTPWIIATRVISSTFASVGSKNLQQPRHLMELHSDEADLNAIVGDLRGYLSTRQTIANINNVADLEATEQIHRINQQTRTTFIQQERESSPALQANHNNQLELSEEC